MRRVIAFPQLHGQIAFLLVKRKRLCRFKKKTLSLVQELSFLDHRTYLLIGQEEHASLDQKQISPLDQHNHHGIDEQHIVLFRIY